MQCKDIADEAFVGAMAEAHVRRGFGYAALMDVQNILSGHPERVGVDFKEHEDQLPTRLVRAKARKLIRRGLIDGCACGCRGDFSMPDA